jgi:hypothetical protein
MDPREAGTFIWNSSAQYTADTNGVNEKASLFLTREEGRASPALQGSLLEESSPLAQAATAGS